MSHATALGDPGPPRSFHWQVGGLILIGLLYLPTLIIPFDFADDGALLYPLPAESLTQRLDQVLAVSAEEFKDRGPYRPISWAHWHAEAVLFGDQIVLRRLVRFTWLLLSAGLTVAWLREMRFTMPVAVTTTTLAFFNPYRNEIWLAFGLTEAFAVPYAMLALLATVRAARRGAGGFSGRWDCVALLGLLLCLGIKNTFAALIPPMVLLRLWAADTTWREGLRRGWLPAGLIALLAVLPATHFVLYKMHTNPAGYQAAFDWKQIPRMTRGVLRAGNLQFASVGFVIAALALWATRRERTTGRFWHQRRVTVLAGLLLLGGGIGIYAPINGVAGRYTLPAVWGLDLLVACLLAALWECPPTRWAYLSRVTLVAGLIVMGVVQFGREWKIYARNELLGATLRYVEQVAPAEATVIWAGTKSFQPRYDELAMTEGLQFQWHLHERGRSDIRVRQLELAHADAPVTIDPPVHGALLVVVGGLPPDGDRSWQVQQFQTRYWAGTQTIQACVWVRVEEKSHGGN